MFPTSLVIDDRRKRRSGGFMVPEINSTVSHRATLLTNQWTALQLKRQAETISSQMEDF